MNKKTDNKYSIAILINKLDDNYHSIVYKSIKRALRSYNVNITILVGRPLDSMYEFDRYHNIVFKYARLDLFDGILIFAGSIFNFVSQAKYMDFLKTFSNKKYLSMDFKIENHPYILIDNFNAMREETFHIITAHKRKKIAFITGKPTSQIATDRFNGYKKALAENGIKYDEKLVIEGDFVAVSGKKAVIELIDNRKIKFDAIIASNDEMIIGASDELKRRGIKIPEDCAVAGCDNFDFVRFYNPPITSIHIPLDKQIEKSFQFLVNHIETESISHEVMSTQLITRRSCGCHYSSIHTNNSDEAVQSDKWYDIIHREITCSNDIHPSVKDIFIHQVESLFNTLTQELENEADNHQKFEKVFISILKKYFYDSQELHSIQKFLSIFEQFFYIHYPSRNDENRISNIFTKLQIFSANFFKSNTMEGHQDIIKFIINSVSIYSDIVPNEDTDQLVFSIFKTCTSVNITTGHIAMFADPMSKNITTIMLSFYNKEILATDTNKLFSEEDLVNYVEKYRHNNVIIALPLTYQNESYGIAFFEENNLNPAIYENLRSQISNAIKGSRHLQEQKAIEKELFETVSVLQTRHNTLQNKLSELNFAQKQIIEKEKNAALGNMVAGISHEINTPLGICITSASHLLERSRYILNLYKNGTLKKSDFESHLDTINKATQIILDNLNKSVQIIGSFKQLAVDQSSNRLRKFNLRQCIDDVLITLHPVLKKLPITVLVDCADNITVNNYPGSLSKALSELINNSIIHGQYGVTNETGEISIIVKKKSGSAVITYADNGKGIPAEISETAFQPFITTRRSESRLGLGLTIIHTTITREMCGSVQYLKPQTAAEGATFLITIPLEIKNSNRNCHSDKI
ncbi:MAG: substrate-binding domain-containing protein [Spirochaetes bacterium]|jgi:DNA-binding LacI/PurR family transcriptional regulator/signal transduction histidine kinase|nr:substrate-binding domain-containing protein [Spirochaetota bacterium]